MGHRSLPQARQAANTKVLLVRSAVLLLSAAVMAWLVYAPATQPLSWCALQAGIVLLLARLFRLRVFAALLLAGLFPLLVLALWLDLPAWLYALAAALTFGLSRNALFERVPFYLSSDEACRVLATWLPAGSRVLDAGSGDGRAVLLLARLRPDIEVLGMENACLPYLLARLRWRLAGSPANAKLAYGSFWQAQWAEYDVVYAFLSPAPMARLWRVFCAGAGADAVLISNTFAIPDVPADEVLALSGPLQCELLIWRHPHAT